MLRHDDVVARHSNPVVRPSFCCCPADYLFQVPEKFYRFPAGTLAALSISIPAYHSTCPTRAAARRKRDFPTTTALVGTHGEARSAGLWLAHGSAPNTFATPPRQGALVPVLANPPMSVVAGRVRQHYGVFPVDNTVDGNKETS